MNSRRTLKEFILNEIDNQPRGYAEVLAKVAGYSNGSNLKKILNNTGKEFDKFNGLIELVKFLFGQDEQKLMEQYASEIDPNNKTARYMLEYLYCNRKFETLKELIDKMLNCKNKESVEYAKLYAIQYEWQVNYYNLDINKFLKSLEEFKTSIPELTTLVKIMKCNSYYKKKMFKISFELSHDINDSLENIKEEYIKSAYKVKFNEIMSYLSLRVLNEPFEAKKYAENVLKIGISKTYDAYAFYVKGCSTFFTSYDESKENFKKSIAIYEETNRKHAANDVMEISELLDVVWDKEIFSIYYSKEYNCYWKVKNNKCLCEEDQLSQLDEPFYYLIKGMAKKSTDFLMQSLIRFVKRGDTFLGTLPKLELIKQGYSETIINEIINLHVA